MLIAVIGMIGINTNALSGVVVGLGAAFAFIMQGTLANIAAGVMLLLFRPYKTGDEVEINGTKGVVADIFLTGHAYENPAKR